MWKEASGCRWQQLKTNISHFMLLREEGLSRRRAILCKYEMQTNMECN